MIRTATIFLALVALLGSAIGAAALWIGDPAASSSFSAPELMAAYGRIRTGITPASQLSTLGLDLGAAGKLSALAVMERFMPRDSFDFDNLDPSVRACFEKAQSCTGYVFASPDQPSARVVLLIEDGRVAYKAISGFTRSAAAKRAAQRASLN